MKSKLTKVVPLAELENIGGFDSESFASSQTSGIAIVVTSRIGCVLFLKNLPTLPLTEDQDWVAFRRSLTTDPISELVGSKTAQLPAHGLFHLREAKISSTSHGRALPSDRAEGPSALGSSVIRCSSCTMTIGSAGNGPCHG